MIFSSKAFTYIHIIKPDSIKEDIFMNKKSHQNTTFKKDEALENETLETTDNLEIEEPCACEKATELAEEIQKWKDLALRSQAEMDNLRKRTQIDIEKAHKYANVSFAKDLLPVADYLQGAIDYAQKEMIKSQESGQENLPFLKSLLTGVELTQKQLLSVFEQHSIKKMEAVGVIFDPNLHKVIQEVEDESKEAGTILQELQSGYTISGDRVLREAMVIVSK